MLYRAHSTVNIQAINSIPFDYKDQNYTVFEELLLKIDVYLYSWLYARACVWVLAAPLTKDNLYSLLLESRLLGTKWSVVPMHRNVVVASAHCRLVLSSHGVPNTREVWSVWNMDSSLLAAWTAFPVTTSSWLALWASGSQRTDKIWIRWNIIWMRWNINQTRCYKGNSILFQI